MKARKLLSNILTPVAELLAAQRERAFLWMPIFLGCGIGFYFTLPFEPDWRIVCGALILIFLLFISTKNKIKSEGYEYFLIILMLVLTGLLTAQIRTGLAYTPLLEKEIGPVIVQAKVLEVESLAGGNDKRLLLGDIVAEELDPAKTPRKMRLRLRKDPGVKVGERIEVLAKLMPPSPPSLPGGFDFQRHFYFQGIGAVGFIFKYIRTLESQTQESFSIADFSIQALRQRILQKIEAAVPGASGGIVQALIINEVSSIPEADQEAMRVAGLAHMLSISGIHVVLVAGGVFFVVRLLLVALGLGLAHPVKKYAAVFGFAAAVFYMLLAGSNIPVQRSVLTSGAVFAAIIFDRFPFSLRLVAFSALVVLFLAPESIVSPSFQMSFAAVVALVWFYEGSRNAWSALAQDGGRIREAALYLAGICATTIVASIATAPFGVYHFQTFGVYSLPANLLGVPILSFFVMPAAMVALLAMPFSLEYWPLKIMGWGSAYILDVAHWAASLPGASVHVPMVPFTGFIGLVAAALMGMFLVGRTKLLALVPLLICLMAFALSRPPDLLVADKGKYQGVVLADGRLALSTKRREKFTAQAWESALGLKDGASIDWKEAGLPCDELGCRFEKYGKKVAFSFRPDAQAVECAWADVVIADYALEEGCASSLHVDRRDSYHQGAYAIWLQGRPHAESAASYRGVRPWTSQ